MDILYILVQYFNSQSKPKHHLQMCLHISYLELTSQKSKKVSKTSNVLKNKNFINA